MGKEFNFDKLKGSDNFHTLKFVMQNFLALKPHTKCIEHRLDKKATTSESAIVYEAHSATETNDKANGVCISGDLVMSDCRGDFDKNSALLSKNPGKKWKKNKLKCFNCGSLSHLGYACDQPKAEKKTEKSTKVAFMMGFLGAINKAEWYIDSGAS